MVNCAEVPVHSAPWSARVTPNETPHETPWEQRGKKARAYISMYDYRVVKSGRSTNRRVQQLGWPAMPTTAENSSERLGENGGSVYDRQCEDWL